MSTFSGGTTGLTPGSASTGAVSLGGVLAVANGGTGSATQNFVDLTTTQNVAGAKTFTTQLIGKGTATNDNAAAGYIGEYHCAQVWASGSPAGCDSNSGTPISLAAGTAANIATLSLTAGDWRVCAVAGSNPLGTTETAVSAGISKTSAAFGGLGTPTPGAISVQIGTAFNGNTESLPVGCTRESLTTTTSVYLVMSLGGSGTAGSGWGLLEAWRTR